MSPSPVVVDEAYMAQVARARRSISRIIYAGGADFAPRFLRLAANDALTYDAATATGGPNASIRVDKEAAHKANAGLATAVAFLEGVQKDCEPMTLADVIQLAGVIALETLGGPEVQLRFGRRDSKVAPPEGRLPAYEYCQGKPGQYAKAMNATGLSPAQWIALAAVLPASAPSNQPPPRHGAEALINPDFFGAWIRGDVIVGDDPTLISDPEIAPAAQQLSTDPDLFYAVLADAWRAMTELGVSLNDAPGEAGAYGAAHTQGDLQAAAAAAAASAMVVAGALAAAGWWLFRRRKNIVPQ